MSNNEPVIVNKSFAGSEIYRLLTKFYKIREADSTIKHSLIFPKRSIAILIQPLCETCAVWPPRGKFFFDEEIIERIDKFQKLHRNPYVFLTSVSITSDEEIVYDAIQNQFFDEKVTFLSCSSAAQCVSVIMNIVTPKQNAYRSDINIAKHLCDGEFSENMVCSLAEKVLGISQYDALVLKDGCQTMSKIANANVKDLMDCSLSVPVAKKVHSYFNKDAAK